MGTDFDQIALIFLVRYGEQINRRPCRGLPVGFHGRQFGGLDFSATCTPCMSPLKATTIEDTSPKTRAMSKRPGEKFDMLFFQQMVGADAHDEKSRQQHRPHWTV